MVVNWMPQVVPNARRGKAKPSKLLFPLSIPNRRGREGASAYSAMAKQPQSRRAVVARKTVGPQGVLSLSAIGVSTFVREESL